MPGCCLRPECEGPNVKCGRAEDFALPLLSVCPCHLYPLDDVVTSNFLFCAYEPAKLDPVADHCAICYYSV